MYMMNELHVGPKVLTAVIWKELSLGLFLCGYLLGLLFIPEDGGSVVL
jgi:hypothetical protein